MSSSKTNESSTGCSVPPDMISMAHLSMEMKTHWMFLHICMHAVSTTPVTVTGQPSQHSQIPAADSIQQPLPAGPSNESNQSINYHYHLSLSTDVVFSWIYAVGFPNRSVRHFAISTGLSLPLTFCCTVQWICLMMSSSSSFWGYVVRAWLHIVPQLRAVVCTPCFDCVLEVRGHCARHQNLMVSKVCQLLRRFNFKRVAFTKWLPCLKVLTKLIVVYFHQSLFPVSLRFLAGKFRYLVPNRFLALRPRCLFSQLSNVCLVNLFSNLNELMSFQIS